MKKTAEEKIKTKEAKLKRATDSAAFLEAEALLQEDTTAKHEWFICNLLSCPLKKKPHSGPFKMCKLCRAKANARPNRADKEKRNAARTNAKKRKLDAIATNQGQTKLPF